MDRNEVITRTALSRSLKVVVAGGILAREVYRMRQTLKMYRGLRRFAPLPDLDTFEESLPRLFMGRTKVPHAVLLLHGYSASPHELRFVIDAMKQEAIPHYAPVLTGHGLTEFRLLFAVKPSDWLRDAIVAYDHLATLAEEVSVVGHSTGATLAVFVSERRPVKHLVLSAPNLIPQPGDIRIKAMLNTPLVGRLILWLLPVFAKPRRPGRPTPSDTLDPEAVKQGFSYATLPTRSLRAQWDLQDRVRITHARWRSLTVVYGEQDLTVDTPALLRMLDEEGIPYTAHALPNAAHNLLQDYDKHQAVQAILAAVQT